MPDQRDYGDETAEGKALKDSPLIVTRGDGIPLPDQAQALRDFKARAGVDVKSEDATRTEPPRYLVTVDIHGDDPGADTLAKLLNCILVDCALDKLPEKGHRRLAGWVDAHIDDFVSQIAERDVALREVRADLEDERNSRIVTERAYKGAVERADCEAAVANALEQRLGDVSARKVALAVAHGDVPPDQYEARRRIEVNGIRDFVAAVRSRLMPRQLGDEPSTTQRRPR